MPDVPLRIVFQIDRDDHLMRCPLACESDAQLSAALEQLAGDGVDLAVYALENIHRAEPIEGGGTHG